MLIAVLAAGSIGGAILAAPLMRRTSERTLIAIALGMCAGSCLLLTTGLLPVVVAGCAGLGASVIWINVGALTLIQRRTPAELIGRVDAALTLGATVPQALSIAAGAGLILLVDYRVLLVVMAVVIAASAAYLISDPDLPAPAAGNAAEPQPVSAASPVSTGSPVSPA